MDREIFQLVARATDARRAGIAEMASARALRAAVRAECQAMRTASAASAQSRALSFKLHLALRADAAQAAPRVHDTQPSDTARLPPSHKAPPR